MTNETITAFYGADHDRLDAHFKEFQRLKRVDLQKAKEHFREFKIGLQRHIVWEEEILFRIFEEKSGNPNEGPTRVMRAEHRVIGAHLDAIHDKIRAGNVESDPEEKLLLETLFAHNWKEESILYPSLDGLVTEEELARVYAEMSEMSEHRYHHCCGKHDHHEHG